MDFVKFKGNKIFVKNGKLDLNSLCIEDMSEIEGLNNLVRLQELDLSNNNLMHIDGLSSLMSLRRLDLSSNDIQEIRNLENLRNLKELILNNLPIPNSTLDTLGGIDANGSAKDIKKILEHCRYTTKKYPNPIVRSHGKCNACGNKIKAANQVICEYCGEELKK